MSATEGWTTLEAYVSAHKDVLDRKVDLDVPGFRMDAGVWLGEEKICAVGVRISGGVLTTKQWRALDWIARVYGNGTMRATTRQTIATHIQLANKARWNELQMLIKDKNLRVCDWPADGHGGCIRGKFADDVADGERCRFRGTVTVHETLRSAMLEDVADAIRVFEDNVEATAAWDGPLFDIWLEYRELIEESRDVGMQVRFKVALSDAGLPVPAHQ